MSNIDDIAISVVGVGKCYRVFDNARARLRHHLWVGSAPGMREVWALRDINFSIKRGESVAIIGRNGGGKSTLLEILTGTLTPTTGKVLVNGRVSALLELGSGFNPEYSGRDNVMLNGLLLGLTKADILARFDDIEAFAEIGAAIDRPVKTYSSGMMVRLAFAVQVLSDPDILIIDEALSVGDFFFQQKCLAYIRALRDRGVTLLFVSHDMSTVRDLCTKGLLLSGGKQEFFGENLEAVRRYFSNSDLPDKKANNEETNYGNEVESNSLEARIINVDLLSEDEKNCTSVRMGSDIIVRTHLISNINGPIDVTVVIKNKHGHVVSALGTYSLKTPFPIDSLGKSVWLDIRVNLSIEAGDYSFTVSLSRPSTDGKIGIGELLFETSPIGPVSVKWDYLNEIPAFYGMVGLKASATYRVRGEVEGLSQ